MHQTGDGGTSRLTSLPPRTTIISEPDDSERIPMIQARRTVLTPVRNESLVAAPETTADLRAAGLKDAVRRWQQKNAVKPGTTPNVNSSTVSNPTETTGGSVNTIESDTKPALQHKRDVNSIQLTSEVSNAGGANSAIEQPPAKMLKTSPATVQPRQPSGGLAAAKTATQSAVASAVRGIAERSISAKVTAQSPGPATFNGPMSFEEIMRAKKVKSQANRAPMAPSEKPNVPNVSVPAASVLLPISSPNVVQQMKSNSPAAVEANNTPEITQFEAKKEEETQSTSIPVEVPVVEPEIVNIKDSLMASTANTEKEDYAKMNAEDLRTEQTPPAASGSISDTVALSDGKPLVSEGISDQSIQNATEITHASPKLVDVAAAAESSDMAGSDKSLLKESDGNELNAEPKLNVLPSFSDGPSLEDVCSTQNVNEKEGVPTNIIDKAFSSELPNDMTGESGSLLSPKNIGEKEDVKTISYERHEIEKLLTAIANDAVLKNIADDDRRAIEEEVNVLCSPILKCEMWRDMRRVLDQLSTSFCPMSEDSAV